MRRSQINAVIRQFEVLLAEHRFALPPFLHFTPREWAEKGPDYDGVRAAALGWDVTDYGEGDFQRLGLSLITLRNGKAGDSRYPKPYAEKIMMVLPGQLSPNHFHWNKMEDIINRGGGTLVFRLWNAAPDGSLADTAVSFSRDGRLCRVDAGGEVALSPGESITLLPGCYHEFTVRAGDRPALVGEVSTCNDDNADNRFFQPLGRFPAIEEDEAPYRLLCSEYPPAAEA